MLVLMGFSQQIVQAEYFFDSDPGYGNGQAINISSANQIEIDEYIDVTILNPGFHSIHFRFKDENNQWSSVYSKGFYIEKNMGDMKLINYVEYFYDADPGYGNGIPITDFTPSTYFEELFFSDISGLTEGTHEFFIRLRDESGQWSQTYTQEFDLLNCDLLISGTVTHQDQSAVDNASVILYQYFGEGSAIGVDTLPLANGYYEFNQVCPFSHYFIKVIPESTTDFLPTYYGNSFNWQEASLISVDESSVSNINITVIDFANMNVGNSQLGGHIYYADSKGEPVKNVDVVLEYDAPDEKADFEAVAYNRSDDDGEWVMQNLPNGIFRIKVEITGLEMDTTYYVNITNAQTIIDDLDFYVDLNNGIFIDHFGIEEFQLSEKIDIYPNPALQSNIWIESQHANVQIEKIVIYNYSGQETGNSMVNKPQFLLNSQSWTKGLYILKIQTNKGIVIKKIIIE
jgi:hypothetical protein